MMIKLSTVFVGLLLYRLTLDLIFFNDKPAVLVAVYLGWTAVFCLLVVSRARVDGLYLIGLFFLVMMWSLFRSSGFTVEQLTHNVKVILIPLFLLCVAYSNINIDRSVVLFRRYALPIVLFGFLYVLLTVGGGVDAFDNYPLHSVSQAIAKTALVYIGVSPLVFFLFVGVLYYLNVRSNFIPILFIGLYYYRDYVKNVILRSILLGCGAVGVAYLFLSGFFDDAIVRVVYRGKEAADIYTASSGRDQILDFYVQYVLSNFGFFDYLFGYGNPSFRGEVIFDTHSDLLGFFVNYGVVGLCLTLAIYSKIVLCVQKEFRPYVIFYLLFVGLTNGVLFHQSTIFISLLFGLKSER